MGNTFDALRPFLEKKRRLLHALSLLNYDLHTTAPKAAISSESDLINSFGADLAAISQDPEFIKAVKEAKDDPTLNRRQKEVVKHLYEDIAFFEKIDLDTYMSYMGDLSKSNEVWREAKQKNDFALYLPYWEKAIEATKAMARIRHKEEHATLYDTCLDMYEEGLTAEKLDSIFNPLREFLVSSLDEVLRKQEAVPLVKIPVVNADKQRRFSVDLLQLIGFDLNRGAIRESMHPFTDCLAKEDARITTRILEEDFRSNLYSVIHEGGHAIEFQHFGDGQYEDYSAGLCSSAICETHSRFYENIIGRNKNFAKSLQKLCQKHFGSPFYFMNGDSFYRLVNDVKPDFIRTEADEFTYCLHIIIRYEIEKDLINGVISAKEVPAIWKAKYKAYLGIDVPNDTKGVLQDVHWSDGSFGYFPTYALGNMYGAMILKKMKEDIPFDKCLLTGDLLPIREWFVQHDFPNDYLPASEWLKEVTGREFTSEDYIAYLKEKFLPE